mmetsp:Transcript_10516/g.12066  ORF Transcript_10516/g.12066 Transcript_10516/m.12066 type:complete len:424 (+) Transcript_10516:355-1626(+)
MKLRIKPLRGGEFVLEDVELTNTVQEIKEKIEKEKGPTFPVDLQKLIHATKIMDNDKTLADYKVKEKSDFLVCMVSKKKKKTAAATTSASAATTATTSTPSTPAAPSTPAVPAASTTPASSPPAANTPAPAAAPAGITISDEDVANLRELGFDEPTVRTALRVAFGNAERAAALLFDPALLLATQQAQEAQAAAGTPATAGGGGSTLDQFRNHPDFNELRRLVQSQPGSMDMILQQIQRSDPGLFQSINDNMEEFVRMMNEPIEDAPGSPGAGGMGGLPGLPGGGQLTPQMLQGMLQMMQQMSPEERAAIAQRMGLDAAQLEMITNAMQRLPPEQLQQMFEQGLGAMGGGGLPGGMGGALPGMDAAQAPAVQLTEEDAEAVARLEAMGFPRHMVLQAYFGCDKNEQLAANFLANMSDDEDNGS